jgi:hypothetical protein
VGNIDLLCEIRLDNTGIADYQRQRPRVRRVYTAKIEGLKSDVTVTVYQGMGAQDVCCIILLAVLTNYETLSGMAGRHGTLLTALVRNNLGPRP